MRMLVFKKVFDELTVFSSGGFEGITLPAAVSGVICNAGVRGLEQL